VVWREAALKFLLAKRGQRGGLGIGEEEQNTQTGQIRVEKVGSSIERTPFF
jgi:hypothetical protein